MDEKEKREFLKLLEEEIKPLIVRLVDEELEKRDRKEPGFLQKLIRKG